MSKKKKPPKYALLIWEIIPEKTEFYLLPLSELTKKEHVWLKRCHGNFINQDSTTYKGKSSAERIDEALTMVNELIADPHASWLKEQPGYFKEQADRRGMKTLEFKSLYGAWHDYKIEFSKPKTIPRARIVHSGFFL